MSTFSGKCTGLAKQIGTGAFGTLTSQKPKSRSSRQPLNPERMSGIAGIRDMSNKSLHRAMRFMLQFSPSESAARCLRLSPARALMDSANPAASSIGTGQARTPSSVVVRGVPTAFAEGLFFVESKNLGSSIVSFVVQYRKFRRARTKSCKIAVPASVLSAKCLGNPGVKTESAVSSRETCAVDRGHAGARSRGTLAQLRQALVRLGRHILSNPNRCDPKFPLLVMFGPRACPTTGKPRNSGGHANPRAAKCLCTTTASMIQSRAVRLSSYTSVVTHAVAVSSPALRHICE